MGKMLNISEETSKTIANIQHILLERFDGSNLVLKNYSDKDSVVYEPRACAFSCTGNCSASCVGSCSGDCKGSCQGSCSGGRA